MPISANLKLRMPAPFPTNVVGQGGIKVQKGGGLWIIAPDFSALAAITSLSNPTSKQVWVFDPVTQVYSVLDIGALGGALLSDTSASAVAIATGTQSFVVNPANFMVGQVTGYATVSGTTTLMLNVVDTGGSGTHSDWVISISGPAQPALDYSGTSTASLTIGTGTQSLTTQAGLSFSAGQFVSIVSVADATKWMNGTVTSYNGTTGALVVLVQAVNGSGTFANWSVNASGPSPAFSGTSTTSLTIGTGNQSLTTQTELSFQAGQFVSLVSSGDASKWMAGPVVSYNPATGALVVGVQAANGSGTLASWSVNVSGAPGNAFTQAAGSAVIDFGAFPGATDAQVSVTGQPGIQANSIVEAWIAAAASADHSADEHWIDPPRVMAGNIVPGTGFTVYGVILDGTNGADGQNPAVGPGSANGNTGNQLCYGKWSVNWRWQ